MIDGINGASTAPDTTSTPKATSAEKDALTDKATFLQLLVAQIKNQDPTKPQDGIEFITQLAQFSSLEHSLDTNKQLTSIHDILANQIVTPAPKPAAAN